VGRILSKYIAEKIFDVDKSLYHVFCFCHHLEQFCWRC